MIQSFADWLVYEIIALDKTTHLAAAINFFVYDSIKILILIFAISVIMGVLNAYLPIEKLRNFLTTRKLYGLEYFLASVFGAITPFCSCSSIPLFIGFVKGGIPLGVTFAYLITSPLVNEIAIAMFLGTFGVKSTLTYLFSGILLGMTGGFVLGKFKLEKYLEKWVIELQNTSKKESAVFKKEKTPFLKILPHVLKDSWDIVKSVFAYVLLGIAIGSIIHGYVPEGFFENYITKDNIFAVPLAVICAVPMYANASGIVPVVQVFVDKGIPLGTAIALMMSVVGLSLPEAILLRKVMTWKLITIFFLTVASMIILSGYIFNIIL